jgi:multicomponent Na+:H+ antiporter subunit E
MRNRGILLGTAVLRWVGYLALWIALIGLDPLDLVVGGFAAVVATWASLRLLPVGVHPVRPAALPRLALRFLGQSVSAGIDVARRAFSPSMPLQPGFLLYPTKFRRGPARNAYASITSLLPGTLAVRDDEQGLLYHCLDLTQPVAAELAVEETEVARALPGAPS